MSRYLHKQVQLQNLQFYRFGNIQDIEYQSLPYIHQENVNDSQT